MADVVNPFHLMLNTLQRCFMLHIYASLPVYSKFLLWPDSDGHANESHYKPKLAVIIHIKTKCHATHALLSPEENAHKSGKLNETIIGCTPDKCTCNLPLQKAGSFDADILEHNERSFSNNQGWFLGTSHTVHC